MPGQNCKTQNETDPLQALPERTWKAYFGEIVRKAGLGAAMMGAGLGLSGFGGIEDKSAEAGIVISIDPNADQRAIDNGVGFSVAGGGNSGYLRGDFNYSGGSGTFYASAVFIDPYTAISNAHNVLGQQQFNTQFSVGTGSNYNSSPGSLYQVSSFIIHPDYTGGASRAFAPDVVVFKFANPVPGVATIQIATSRPAEGTEVWIAGYGQGGTPARGYSPQDGNLRAGTSLFTNLIQPLAEASPLLYGSTFFDDILSNPTGIRPAPGDSGSGLFISNSLLGLNTIAPFSSSSPFSTFLDLSVPTTRDFVLSNSSTAVPEPSSLLMLGAVTAAAAFVRRRMTKSAAKD